jgi:hypothetical protein
MFPVAWSKDSGHSTDCVYIACRRWLGGLNNGGPALEFFWPRDAFVSNDDLS